MEYINQLSFANQSINSMATIVKILMVVLHITLQYYILIIPALTD